MDILRRIIALENKVSHLEGRHEPKVVHMRPRAPVDLSGIPATFTWGASFHVEDAARSVMVPRDAEDDMA